MEMMDAIEKARALFARTSRAAFDSITGASHAEDGWEVTLEAVERRSIPDSMDILGTYSLRLDEAGNMRGFERKSIRKRGDSSREDF